MTHVPSLADFLLFFVWVGVGLWMLRWLMSWLVRAKQTEARLREMERLVRALAAGLAIELPEPAEVVTYRSRIKASLARSQIVSLLRAAIGRSSKR